MNYHHIILPRTPRAMRSAAGKTLALTRLEFRPCFQNPTANLGARVSYSTDGLIFTAAPAPTGTITPFINNGALLTVDLSGIGALQNTAATITFRVYLYGSGPYENTGLGGPGDDLTLFGSFATPLDLWRALHGLAADGSQDLQNPSRDGTANLLKFALNLAPNAGDLLLPRARTLANPDGLTLAELMGLPLVRRDAGGHLQIVFLRRKDAAVNYRVEFCDDISASNWTVNAGGIAVSVDATWERVTVTDSVTAARRCVRLRVE